VARLGKAPRHIDRAGTRGYLVDQHYPYRAIDVYRRGRVRRENLHISWEDVERLESAWAPQNVEAEVDLAPAPAPGALGCDTITR